MSCARAANCKAFVEGAHARFLEEYGLSGEETPLLGMHLGEWEAPFVGVASRTSRIGG